MNYPKSYKNQVMGIGEILAMEHVHSEELGSTKVINLAQCDVCKNKTILSPKCLEC